MTDQEIEVVAVEYATEAREAIGPDHLKTTTNNKGEL